MKYIIETVKKATGKALGICLAAAMILGLTACQAGNPAVESPAATTAPAVAETTAAQLADAAEILEAAAYALEPKKLYESDRVSVALVDLLEDTAFYHMIMKADNKTAEDGNIEITAVAFNGITAENSSGWSIPASGDAYLYISFEKKNLNIAGVTGMPGVVKVGFTVYDSNYEKVDEGIAECVLDGANSKPAQVPEGETVYNEEGIKITSLGLSGSSPEEMGLNFCVENNTEELILMNGGAAMAPGEELSPSVYAYVLPGTRAITTCYFYNQDYSAPVSPATLPLVDMIFRIESNGGEDVRMTEPVTVKIGDEQRFRISEDGKTLTVSQEFWTYDDTEWTVTSSNPDALVFDSKEIEADTPTEGRHTMTATFHAVAEGDATVTLKYHPIGISLEITDDYWPTIYCAREIRFHVNEDGTIEPGDVWLEIPNLSDEGDNSFWYYIIRKDGSVAAKNDAAG